MINGIGLPPDIDLDLQNCLVVILQRAVDGTVKPFFVDSANQRVIVGGTTTTGSNSKLQVQGGDVEVTTAGNGIIIPNRAGTHRYRILVENDGTLTVDNIS